MVMLNKFIGIGRLGQDPIQKTIPNGTEISNFSVATTEKYKKDGEYIEKTEWIKAVAFGKLAEICNSYLRKGSLVYIEGSLQTRTWDDKEGNKKYTTEVIIREMKMLDKKGTTSESGNENRKSEEDDVPF